MAKTTVPERIYNFSSGPAALPTVVLERARDELLSFRNTGMSILEISHRSKLFESVLAKAEQGIRQLMNITDEFRVLFLQGGASTQFSMVPMNLLPAGRSADYVITGSWGRKAAIEADRFGKARIVFDGVAGKVRSIPDPGSVRFSADAAYIHYTSNETIDGVEFPYEIDGHGIPVVCDASSNILSRRFDLERYDLIYAGAQKNIGPSGVTVVIVRSSLLEFIPDGLPTLLDYRSFAANDSMPNTPNTWGIYMMGLVCDWLIAQGGIEAIEIVNAEKAALLYEAIDASDGFYSGTVERNARSRMNVAFRLPTEDLEDRFCNLAEKQGMSGLRGHRSVGGIRASIYNAFPKEGVQRLVEFMSEFAAESR